MKNTFVKLSEGQQVKKYPSNLNPLTDKQRFSVPQHLKKIAILVHSIYFI
jgi:hypothetical protein